MKNNEYADYLKTCNFVQDSTIYFYFRFTKILKIHFCLNICYMKICMFGRIEAISYSCHILLPFILLKTKCV